MRTRLEALARILGWLAVIVIIVLSVLPGEDRPHTGVSGHFEHVIAYSITAALLTFGYKGWRSAITIVSGLAFLAGLMEFFQIYIPGRHSGFDDFASSAIGAIFGIALANVLSWDPKDQSPPMTRRHIDRQ